jgi:hypothetical protein
MFVHSRFIENPLIDLQATNTSFLRWFYHTCLVVLEHGWILVSAWIEIIGSPSSSEHLNGEELLALLLVA